MELCSSLQFLSSLLEQVRTWPPLFLFIPLRRCVIFVSVLNELVLIRRRSAVSCAEQRCSAVSLRSITTEVLMVLNATEDLLQGAEGPRPGLPGPPLPPDADPKKLDQQFSRLEESVRAALNMFGL